MGKVREKFMNKTFTSNNYGDFEVVDYISCGNVTVVFKNTGVELKTNTTSIISGNIRDPSITKFAGDRRSTKRCKHLGNIYTSNNYGDYVVVEALDDSKVRVNFLNTGNSEVINRGQISSGLVRDSSEDVVRKSKTNNIIHKVGNKGEDKNLVKENFRIYQTWCSMLQRCYSPKTEYMKRNYEGCTVSENFKYFPYFCDWYNSQTGFSNGDWQLDKDILFKGNKLYSEDTCVLVPREINVLCIKRNKARGKYPIGVTYCKSTNKFKAQISKQGVVTGVGNYNTIDEAFYAYKQAKEAYIKEVAEKWKYKIGPKVYDALMQYEVEITD